MNGFILFIAIILNSTMDTKGNEDLTMEKEPASQSKDMQMESQEKLVLPEKPPSPPLPPKFPTTLEGFGYMFNDKGKLLSIATNEPFVFNVREGDNDWNQMHYEALGEVITEYVYKALEDDIHMKKVYLPVDATESEPQSFFFMTDDALTNKEKLLILVHGSGVVKAGQWSRRLIINDCLDSGTQFPFIKRAVDEDYGVIVLNGNDNYRIIDQTITYIRGSDRPENHIRYVWDHFIRHAKAKYISFIAHSYGGVAVFDLASNRLEEMKSRVCGIAFTASVHILLRIPPSVVNWIHNIGRNWVRSYEPLDKPVKNQHQVKDVPAVSAGTQRHDMTSWSSFASIFPFLDMKRKEFIFPNLIHEEL